MIAIWYLPLGQPAPIAVGFFKSPIYSFSDTTISHILPLSPYLILRNTRNFPSFSLVSVKVLL